MRDDAAQECGPRLKSESQKARRGRESTEGFGGLVSMVRTGGYFTTDWKSGEVSRLANWLSEEE